MKSICVLKAYSHRYPKDIKRIIKAFVDEDMIVTPEQANDMWELYSDSMCAGWMGLPESGDDLIVAVLRPYFQEISG